MNSTTEPAFSRPGKRLAFQRVALAAMLCTATFADAAPKPSFECKRVFAPLPKAICTDPDLARHDAYIASALPRMCGRFPERCPQVQKKQEVFVIDRDKQCGSGPRTSDAASWNAYINCLRQAYFRHYSGLYYLEAGWNRLDTRTKAFNMRGMPVLPPEEVRKAIHQHDEALAKCHEYALLKNPDLDGKILVGFVVDEKGNVKSAKVQSSDIDDPDLSKCVLDRLKEVRFPAPLNGKEAAATYPFSFSR